MYYLVVDSTMEKAFLSIAGQRSGLPLKLPEIKISGI